MKLLVLSIAAAALAAAPKASAAAASSTQDAASAASTASPLQLRPKAGLAAAKTHTIAPFVAPVHEPELDLLPRVDPRLAESRSSCNRDTALCYDPDSRRIVYKPARALMPELPGLQRENISVRRDRITFKYSF